MNWIFLSEKVKQHKGFLIFIFLFSYAHSIQIRILVRRKIDWYVFTPEGAVFSFISALFLFFILDYFNNKWQKSNKFKLKEILKIFSASLISYLLIVKLIGLTIALIFDTFERNFNSDVIFKAIFFDLMDAFIYGSFYLAYKYYQKNKQHEKQLAIYNQALAETKISQLKNQLNPHFLFNNLNILDQFIDENKDKASQFLNEFSEIYRYILDVSDKKIILVDEELNFAKQYFEIIKHKYEESYQLEIHKENSIGYIAPLTLQLLIENAVKHNYGTIKNPVYISISINHQVIVVQNNLIPISTKKIESKRALKNLEEQYQLLSQEKIVITKSNESFTIQIPIIHDKNSNN